MIEVYDEIECKFQELRRLIDNARRDHQIDRSTLLASGVTAESTLEKYGQEMILDLQNCDVSMFNRDYVGHFCRRLCVEVLEMTPCDLYFWDDEGISQSEQQTNPKTKGITAIQFLLFSNITIHCLELLETVYLNVFSCREFDDADVESFAQEYFKATRIVCGRTIPRYMPISN